MRLSTIAIVVSDAKKSAKWYQEKLGFEIRDHQGHWITVAPKQENFAFHLCEGYDLEPGNSGIAFTTKNVKGDEAALRKLGVEFTTPTTKDDWGSTYAMFRDPDGNEFYLNEE